MKTKREQQAANMREKYKEKVKAEAYKEFANHLEDFFENYHDEHAIKTVIAAFMSSKGIAPNE